MNAWRVREMATQARVREANEAIEEARDSAGHRPLEVYICECSDPACTAAVRLSRGEYEGVRAFPTHFLVALDHEDPEVDTVLIEFDRYSTIAKLPGVAARYALDTDPRRPDPTLS